MYQVLTILIVILAVILILTVLVQNSKGGGLASNFASSNQIMGVRKTTDFLEKTTWGLISAIVVLSVAAVGFHKSASRTVTSTSEISNQIETPIAAPAGFDDAAAAPIEVAPVEEAPIEATETPAAE